MPGPRRRRLLVAVTFLVASFGLATATAFAQFANADSVSHTLGTAVLEPPTDPAVGHGECTVGLAASVVVTWTPTTSTWAAGYEVLRSLLSNGPFTVVASVPGGSSSSYHDTLLPFVTPYYYQVRATKEGWRSAPTAAVNITTRTALCT